MEDIAHTTSIRVNAIYQSYVNDITALSIYASKVNEKVYDPIYLMNTVESGLQLALDDKNDEFDDYVIKGWDPEVKVTYGRSMWYSNADDKQIRDLTEEKQQQLEFS